MLLAVTNQGVEKGGVCRHEESKILHNPAWNRIGYLALKYHCGEGNQMRLWRQFERVWQRHGSNRNERQDTPYDNSSMADFVRALQRADQEDDTRTDNTRSPA